jgi:hypothetical protein
VGLAALLSVAVAAPVPKPVTPDWTAAIKDREFRFETSQAGITPCVEAARKAGAEVTVDGDPTRGSLELKVTLGGKPVGVLAHVQTVFAIREGVLYVADFSPYASGCKVVAYELKTGKKLWNQNLEGLGPIDHTKYRNRVTLMAEKHPTAAGWAVVVTGWEAAGRYLEVLDLRTGKQLAHKKYE